MSQTREIVSVITCDLEGRIETFNPNAEKLFGYSADEVIGKKTIIWSTHKRDQLKNCHKIYEVKDNKLIEKKLK